LYREQYIILNNELARCKRNDDAITIAVSREDIKNLDESYKQFNILKNAEDYISHLSRCLPNSIKDRIYKDSLKDNLELEDNDDLNEDKNFKRQLDMIGEYTVSELQRFKNFYKKSGIINGPKELIDKAKYKDFLNE
jgi:hypothetical protein